MKTFLAFVVILASAPIAAGQSADRYRGGWRTDDADPHTYEFSIRGERVRGIYCTLCSDATTLAFIDGTFGANGITFVVTHVRPDGSTAYQDKATARIDGDKLIVAGTSGAPRSGRFQRTLYRDSRGPDPLPVPVSWLPDATGRLAVVAPLGGRGGGAPPAAPPGGGAANGAAANGGAAPRATGAGVPGPGVRGAGGAAPGAGGGAAAGGPGRGWQQPGPWKNPLTMDDVAGVWIGFGTGVIKQYFIFRRVGKGLRGMVCGRCDNPFTLAALDDFQIEGDTLHFKILHDAWGDSASLPFDKSVTARIVANELRAVFETPTEAGGRGVTGVPPSGNTGTTLIGPLAIEATRGNDSRPNR
jgi:hypothetical protein